MSSLLLTALLCSADPPAAFKLTADEQAVLDATNAERKTAGLPPLKADPVLTKMARDYSATMAKENKLGHDVGGVNFPTRLKASGYKYAAGGENVGQGYKDPKAAVEGWMNSPPHKLNLLSKEYAEIGVATVDAADGTRYWTQVFAAPLK